MMGNVNWQNWSQFGLVGISVNSANPRSLTTNLQYDDTWQIAAGAQFKVSPELLLSAGFAYDSSMVSDSERTVSAPIGAQYRDAAGVQYRWNEHLTTGLSYEFMWEGKLPLSQSKGLTNTALSGQFTNTLINFFAVRVVYVFSQDAEKRRIHIDVSPIVTRLGANRLEPVIITVGATVLSDTPSLVVFAICISTFRSGFSTSTLAAQLVEMAAFVPLILFGVKSGGSVRAVASRFDRTSLR